MSPLAPGRQTYHSFVLRCSLWAGLLLWVSPAFAQSRLPVIQATSKTVDIRDGNHFKKGYWAIMPERKPDYYFVEIPEKAHQVTFITDRDSISFDVSYGKDYDFIILLNGKDSCYTRISATYKNRHFSKSIRMGGGPDTIPFTLGDNRKVYVQARLNGADVENNQLDLGAGGTIINQTSVHKAPIHFDDSVNLVNSDGLNRAAFASNNHLQIGDLDWDSVPVVVAHNMKPNEDLLIGNSLFNDKILEIDYDKQILVVHDTVPFRANSYSRHDIVLDGGIIPYIGVSLTTPHQTQTGWAMFDTGARITIINSADVSMFYRVMIQLASLIGLDRKISPKLKIGNYELSGFEFKTRDMGKDGLKIILGNELLKRFNLILDNKKGYMYMKPNSLFHTPYGKPDEYYVVRLVAVLVLIAAILILFIKVRKKRMGRV